METVPLRAHRLCFLSEIEFSNQVPTGNDRTAHCRTYWSGRAANGDPIWFLEKDSLRDPDGRHRSKCAARCF